MLQGWVIGVVSLAYLGALFGIAWYSDRRADQGRIAHRKRPIDPYIVPIAADEMSAYHHLRIKSPVAAE